MFGFGSNKSGPKDTEYYDILGLKPDATQDQISKAYRKKARTEHPDRHPPEKRDEQTKIFQKIAEAHNVLSDEKKRQIYDQAGKDGLDGFGEGPDVDPFEVFNDFFGQGNGFPGGMGGFFERTHQRKPKPPTVKHAVQITLADMYTGKELKINLKQEIICTQCQGKGSSNPSAIKRCDNCNGRGNVSRLQQLGPGMMRQFQERCKNCNGKGQVINPEDLCSYCEGNRILKVDKTHKINIKPGMKPGMAIQIPGEGNQHPDLDQPGDLAFIIQEKKGYNPSNLIRQGHDLVLRVKLSLVEALTGFKLVIYQLDGRQFVIDYTGKTVQSGSVMKIADEGMPVIGQNGVAGDLMVHFTVELPKTLDKKRKEILKQVLGQVQPARINPPILQNHVKKTLDETLEEVPLNANNQQESTEEFFGDEEFFREKFQGGGNPFASQMGGNQMGEGVQCATQ